MKQATPKKMLTIKTIHLADIKMEFIIQIRKLLICLWTVTSSTSLWYVKLHFDTEIVTEQLFDVPSSSFITYLY
jgi:ABC-type uncharacterized transport system permease subunit